MKFLSIIEKTIGRQNPRRVRIKYDPLNKEHQAFKAYAGYEGYVLEECEGTVSVYVIKPAAQMDAMVHMPASMMDATSPRLESFKKFLVSKIGNETVAAMTMQLQDIVAIEAILKDNGMNDVQCKDLYREYMLQ